MDVHRCRFVQYPASAINAIAFSHPSTKKSSARHAPVRLAIGRANGDIEIWNPANGEWFQETVIHGGRDRSIDGLVWVTGDDEELPDGKIIYGKSRLFSIGYTTAITEWDLEQGRAKRHASGQHGDIWSLGVQPVAHKEKANGTEASSSQTPKLVAGTMDGSLVLYSIDDDDLRLQRVFVKTPSKKVKIVSIAFQSRNVAVVGCSDSTIRVYSMKNGTLIRKMTLGSDLAGGSKEIIVWSVKCLQNGDIVSGDSTGQICIWDGKTYTQAQRIQSHKQDVLSLATSADGSTIISGGMDRRTVLYRPMASKGAAVRWAKVWHRRYNGHDVKAMASFEDKNMSVVVLGGPDATPVVIPLRQAGMENHRTLSHLPQDVPLASAPKARLIATWWEREVQIWRLRRAVRDALDNDDEGAVEKNRKLIARILIKGELNITSASISDDGSFLVVSTASDIKAFHLKLGNSSKEDLSINQVPVPASIAARGANEVRISPDKQWLCTIQDGSRVLVAKITWDETDDPNPITISARPIKLTRLRRNISKYILLGGLGSYDRRITHASFSPDSKMLAAADLAGYIDTWVLRDASVSLQNGTNSEEDGDDASSASSSSDVSDDEQESDENGSRWIRNPKASLIPKLPSAPVVLSFSNDTPGSPSSIDNETKADDYILLAVTTSSRIFTFHPLKGAMTNWSRRNTFQSLPNDIRVTRDIAKGVIWQGSRVWIYSVSFLFMLDLSADISRHDSSSAVVLNGQKEKGTKRKRGRDTGAGNRMERGAIGPYHVRIADGEDGKGGEWVDVDMVDADEGRGGQAESSGDQEEDDEDEDDDTEGGELQLLRNGHRSEADDESSEATAARKKWWRTYKYRPILGIVPLETSHDEADGVSGGGEAGQLPPLEVALVERPIWDVDLPERYLGEDEFER